MNARNLATKHYDQLIRQFGPKGYGLIRIYNEQINSNGAIPNDPEVFRAFGRMMIETADAYDDHKRGLNPANQGRN